MYQNKTSKIGSLHLQRAKGATGMDAEPSTGGNRYRHLPRAVIVLVLIFLGGAAWASPDISINAPAVGVQGEALHLELELGTVAGNGSVPVDVTVSADRVKIKVKESPLATLTMCFNGNELKIDAKGTYEL